MKYARKLFVVLLLHSAVAFAQSEAHVTSVAAAVPSEAQKSFTTLKQVRRWMQPSTTIR
jgi:hypothetical protein